MAQARKIKAEVTDHAAIRYMDRVLGLKPDVLKEEMLDQDNGRLRHACQTGASGVTIGGLRYVIKRGRVVTITVADKGAV